MTISNEPPPQALSFVWNSEGQDLIVQVRLKFSSEIRFFQDIRALSFCWVMVTETHQKLAKIELNRVHA